MILGLDISTSVTGYTILDEEAKIIICEAWDLRNKRLFSDLYNKGSFIKEKLKEINLYYNIKHVYIEEPFVFFKSGGSTAKTMAKLQAFNGIVSWLCHDTFGYRPVHISPAQARKLSGIKVSRGQKAKDVVLDYLLKNEESFTIEYTSRGNPKPVSYDRADSLIIARAAIKLIGDAKNGT
jgi:Holliday junction resolvasome RuvABC endonuclease subunit